MAGAYKITDAAKLAGKIPFFAGLRPTQVRDLLTDGKVRSLSTGEALCREGEPSESLFILLSGSVSVRVGDVELARVGAVEILGEMGLVTGKPRCATVLADRELMVLEIGKTKFDVAVGVDVDLAARLYHNLLRSSFDKLKAMNDHFLECRHSDGSFGVML